MSLLPPRKPGETPYDEALRQLTGDDIMRAARYRFDHDSLCYVQEPGPDLRQLTTAETLGFNDAVLWAFNHTGHFTREPSRNLLLRLASAVTPQFRCVQWLSQHGEDITVTYNSTTELYTCEATPRAEPAGTTLLRELRHARGIDG